MTSIRNIDIYLDACLTVSAGEWSTVSDLKDGFTVGLWMQPNSGLLSTLLREASGSFTVFELLLDARNKSIVLELFVLNVGKELKKISVRNVSNIL